jgi:hypothetical protein
VSINVFDAGGRIAKILTLEVKDMLKASTNTEAKLAIMRVRGSIQVSGRSNSLTITGITTANL